ncbi:MAG: Holliday junction resolvase RuvX [Bacteroidota bacterium]
MSERGAQRELNTLGRILGIDFGSRRIGISLSDPLQIIAQSLETIPNNPLAFDRITEIADRERVELIVVGMPFNLKGEKGQKAQEVERFITQLEKQTRLQVVRWDERFTSSLAHDTLLRMGTKRKERREHKGRVDAIAAAIMLQSFLDSRKRSLSC